jgi:hypothetical protein
MAVGDRKGLVMHRTSTVILIGVVASLGTLSACGATANPPAPASATASAASSTQATTTPQATSSTQAPTGALSLAGTPVIGAFSTSCSSEAGMKPQLQLRGVAKPSGQVSVSVRLSEDKATVVGVTANVGTAAYVFSPASAQALGSSATLTVRGSTYVVSGALVDAGTRKLVPLTLSITCGNWDGSWTR